MSQCAKSVLFKKSVLREILLPKIILIFFLGSFLLAPFHLFAKEILKGKVTNLPIPRYVSLKVNEANARRGPSLSHKIDWIYKRKNMPLEIYGEYENWRRVRDFEGLGGWVHYTLLSGIRYVLVKDELLEMRLLPSSEAQVIARLPQHNIATLDKCNVDWCRIVDDGYKGWVLKSGIWGVYENEIKD
jgi:SH3-like domain-containing protein